MNTEISHSEERSRVQKGTMHRVFKLLAWVNGLAAVCLAMLLALPSFIDWSAYKEKIALLARDRLGAHVKIEGAVYAQFLPAPIFKLNRVTISGSDNLNSKSFSAKRLDIELAFLPLIKGDLEPKGFELQEPEFVFDFTKQNGWVHPFGLKEIFLGNGAGGLSRFGVKKARLVFGENEMQPHIFADSLSFVAEKSGGDQNWFMEGEFTNQKNRHLFELITRARPERNTTFVDAKVKMTSGGDVIHSFNGSVYEANSRIFLEGRYKSNGRIGHEKQKYALSARGKISASNSHIDLSGLNLSASSESTEQNLPSTHPLIMSAEIKAQRNPQSGKWALNSEITAENLEGYLLASLVSAKSNHFDALYDFNKIAPYLEGHVSVRGKNFRSTRGVFPSYFANFSVRNNLVHIAGAGLGLPEGGRLQTDLISAREISVDGKKEVKYQGAVFLKTDKFKDVARILPTLFNQQSLERFSNASSPISLGGMLQITKNGLSIDAQNLVMNGARGSVKFAVNSIEPARSDISLRIEKVNLDRLLKTSDTNSSHFFSLITQQDVSSSDEGQSISDKKLDISIGKVFWRGTALSDLSLQGLFTKEAVRLKKLAIGGADTDNLSLKISGKVTGIRKLPKGVFDVNISSPQALDALSLIAPDYLGTQQGKELIRRSHIISPFSLKARFVSSAQEKHLWNLDLEGRLASTQFTSEGSFTPQLVQTGLMPANIDLQIEIANPNSRFLASQLLALPSEKLTIIPETEGYVRASVSGSKKEGFEIALGSEVSDLQLALGGSAQINDGRTSLATQVKLTSPDSQVLFKLAGITKPTKGAKTEFVANFAGDGAQYVFSGGQGILAGMPVGLDARIDMTSKKPSLAFHLHADRFKSDFIQKSFKTLLDSSGIVDEVAAHFNTKVALTSPMLSLQEGLDIADAKIQMRLHKNKVSLSSLEGEYYGGKLQVKGEARKTSEGVQLLAQYELTNGDLERALVQENMEKIAKGRFILAGEITAEAKNISQIKRSINGRGYLKVGKGELRGLNPAAFGRSVRFVSNGTELDGMIGGILSEGSIPFSQFQTAYKIRDGKVETEQTQLISREVRSENKTRIDLVSATVESDWSLQLTRLPKTPAVTLRYSGKSDNLARRLEHNKLRSYLLSLMRKGEVLSKRFAAQQPLMTSRADSIETGSIGRANMKKPLKLDGLKIIPKVNPLRGSH